MDRYKLTAIIISIAVVATIIIALQAIDNPLVEAEQKKDEKRMQDFSQIFYAVQGYYQENKQLPQKLDQITHLQSNQKIDSITKKEYEYQPVDSDSFKLCTEFATDSQESNNEGRPYAPIPEAKKHKKGYDCIEYTLEVGLPTKPLPPYDV